MSPSPFRWGGLTPGATPPVDLPLASTLKLIGVFAGKPNAVFFFVPPETLARAVKGQPYDASAVLIIMPWSSRLAKASSRWGPTNYAAKLNAASAKSFTTMAEGGNGKGLIFSQATVPYYILAQTLQKVSSNVLSTPVSADAGH